MWKKIFIKNCSDVSCINGLPNFLLNKCFKIEKVEFMHNKDLIHRDIKPENFLVGRGKRANMLYIVDYGLAKRFYDKKTK